MSKVTIKDTDESIKIYFDGVLHLLISKIDLLGIQSWVENANDKDRLVGFQDKKYVIEYTFRENTILCEYYKDNWLAILAGLDKNLI